jgi:serine/threonine-protein kinase
VYGVGAILYELLVGAEINLDLEALAHLGVEGWPHLRPLSQLRPDIPADIDGLVFKALAYDREARYPTCAAFEDAIDEFATRHGLVASDKLLVQWLEREIAALEQAAAS